MVMALDGTCWTTELRGIQGNVPQNCTLLVLDKLRFYKPPTAVN